MINKKHLIISLIFSIFFVNLHAQWQTSGNNIFNTNSGNVGIGVNNPSQRLEIAGNIRLVNYAFIRNLILAIRGGIYGGIMIIRELQGASMMIW